MMRLPFPIRAALLCIGTLAIAGDPPFYPDKTRLLVYRNEFNKEFPVTTVADWQRRREHILANMQLVMGPLPDDSRRVPLDVQIDEEVRTERYLRKKLTFAAEKGDRVPAYLLIPLERSGKLPAVLCLHETNGKLGKGSPVGLGGRPSLHYGVHLTERGYVVLAPDYPSFGDYRYDFAASSYVSGSMKAIWNNQRAIDLLESLPEVNAERIGCIGHSLGGHNALFTAAFDMRIKALVCNCGFTSFPRYYGGNVKGWTSARYMPRIANVYDLNPAKIPFDFPEVLAAIAPRACLAIAPLYDENFDVTGVRDVMAAVKPVYEFLKADRRHELFLRIRRNLKAESPSIAA